MFFTLLYRLLALTVLVGSVSSAQLPLRLGNVDRIRLAEAFRIARELGDSLWNGWSSAPFAVLLVTPDQEFLIRHPKPSPGFTPLGYDSLLQSAVYAGKRSYDIHFQATFPAIQGSLIPTIVIGQAESTSSGTSTPWVITLLHEHFHQYQMSQPQYFASVESLKLSHGDQTGMWMLNFPFPYDSIAVQEAFSRLSSLLIQAFETHSEMEFRKRLAEYLSERELFRRLLKDDEYRYFSFQLWQEGIARYTELRMTELVAKGFVPSAGFSSLYDVTSFASLAETTMATMHRELVVSKLGERKREMFYPFGGAEGLLLDRANPTWRSRYLIEKFFLEGYMVNGPR